MFTPPSRPPTPPEETEPIMIHISRDEFFRLIDRIEELAVIAQMETDRVEEMMDEEIDIDDMYQRRVRASIVHNIDYIGEEVDRIGQLLLNHEHYLNE